ncbi:TPA: hypothetical protein DIV49_02095 [Candidatus Saccharibacteria bacterium]|nr:hypothetical protein [Candidatus Saccharibacteria bacterium]HRJ91246.1 hypothetical protein [Candidatus Saccharibacteria bacterium]
MKDIDFDELDKAVSSLMGKTPEEPAATPAVATEPESPQPVAVSPTPEVKTPVPVAAKPAAPAAKRGRFMDVMGSAPARKPLAAPSRTGVSIAPPTSTTDTVPIAEPEVPVVTSVDSDTSETSVEDTKASTETNWPDPLEMTSPKESESESTPGETAQVDAEPENSDSESTDEPTELTQPETPPESPFIADAKVEKRPLGGEPATAEASTDLTPDLKLEDEKPTDEDTTEAVTEPAPTAPVENQPMPAELSGDVVHVESDNPLEDTDSPRDKEESQAKNAPAVTSISQQYKEQASSGDQDHTAIYDVANYSEPLAHPAKKKASWLWVVWILLLLALGVGGAITLYLMGVI